MKTVVMTEYGDFARRKPGTVRVLEVSKPKPGPEEVLIRIAYASICGSDAHIVRGNLSPEIENRVRRNLPYHMGHEISGVIEDLGEEAKAIGFKAGDRITANYTHFCNSCYFCRTGQENFCTNPKRHMDGMSEYVVWHMSQIYKIPDDVPLLHASQTEPMSIALNACQTVGVRFGSRVLVSGVGAIGLYAVQLARRAGASLVVASDVVPEKLEIARNVGAHATVNPTASDWMAQAMAHTDGLGFDAVLECSGASSAAQAMPDLMTKNGHCVMFAMYDPAFEMRLNPYRLLYERSLHIHGMYTSADAFPQTVSMLRDMRFDGIIQESFAPEQCHEAFEKMLSGKYIKLVFRFSDDQ